MMTVGSTFSVDLGKIDKLNALMPLKMMICCGLWQFGDSGQRGHKVGNMLKLKGQAGSSKKNAG